ncbi:MBL fold metallo-hydrolase [Rapidithrix thailandica]|uniref:MBL fold metallo-hydrolase n=1 Tax=Rapidithrix thailandica TaxID=413964 RepID=A0AAW9RZJ5_9BACT
MKITFLGTGTSQGVPVILCDCPVCQSVDYRDQRLRTSIHLEVDGLSLVIDTGPDFRQQMLREQIQRVDALLFTHQHKDHTAGLDDIRPYYFHRQNDMPVYAQEEVIEHLAQEFSYMFEEKRYPGVAGLEIHAIDQAPFTIGTTEITPIEVLHFQLPVLGFRIHDFTYITDANYISEVELEKVMGSEVLVINALQKEDHHSHFTLQEAIEISKKAQVKQTYLTHISHRMGRHAEVEGELPENIKLAYDGLRLNLS